MVIKLNHQSHAKITALKQEKIPVKKQQVSQTANDCRNVKIIFISISSCTKGFPV